MDMTVTERRPLTPAITEFTLEPTTPVALPAAEPGAHVSITTPSGARRRYSLVEPSSAPARYRIAVKREAASRGGSSSMHDAALEGARLEVDPPENGFPLAASGAVLLIAGGVGVTPIYAMAQDLSRSGRAFRLVYCTRDAAQTAYREELAALCGDRMTLHHDDGDPARAFDFWSVFAEPTAERVYCCGPAPLMEEVRAVSGHWPEGRVQFEDFKPVEAVRADDRPFTVALARSGAEIEVPADRSILEALRAAGVTAPSSCESGTCGTCRCGLVDGAVDHRDMVLTEEERAGHIMLCVSRAQGDRLVLDL